MLNTPSRANSPEEMKKLHDTFKQSYLAYKNIKSEQQNDTTSSDSTDDLIQYLIWSRLDEETQLKYEQQIEDRKQIQPLNNLFSFLESRFIVLSSNSSKGVHSRNKAKSTLTTTTTSSGKPTNVKFLNCRACDSSKHDISSCSVFLKLSQEDRLALIKTKKICCKCLKLNHTFNKCPKRCSQCNGYHHKLLHDNFPRKDMTSGDSNQPLSASTTVSYTAKVSNVMTVMPTAIVDVFTSDGSLISCRALMDTASQSNFISTSLLGKLGISTTQTDVSIGGIGGTKTAANLCSEVRIKSRISSDEMQFYALVLDEITSTLPQDFINVDDWKLPNGIKLADPSFNVPGPIDILLGPSKSFAALLPGQLSLGENKPIVQKTIFGWVVAGDYLDGQRHYNISSSNICRLSYKTVDEQLEKFWKLEHHDLPSRTLTHEEATCDDHFINNFDRSEEGRFIVKIPFNKCTSQLGDSRDTALRRFFYLERKLSRNPELRSQYIDFMREYQNLGHMSKISTIPKENYFIPHHCVIKPTSSTTKLRVVFDASAQTTSGLSLNSLQMIGKSTQPELFDILLGFRAHRYVLTSDIKKMYRQIQLHNDDKHFHLIFWREDPKKPVEVFQLNTVTYGTASAPFLATRCLKQLALNEGDLLPRAAKAISEQTYVDDILTGSSTIDGLQETMDQLVQLLNYGGFELGKFCSNSEELLRTIPECNKEKMLHIDDSPVIKTLGMMWNPTTDTFKYVNNQPEDVTKITKRTVLSQVARLFDPLGLVGPVVLLGKIFIQDLWKNKLAWDDDVINTKEWLDFLNQLEDLKQIKIPRWVFMSNISNVELHAFSDASTKAYGCCIYIRCTNDKDEIQSRLVCSKSRLAPTSSESIPRLELCAALLMVELVHRVNLKYRISKRSLFYYTDSEIVMTWIQRPCYSLETFVNNRVAKIQRLTDIKSWNWIEGNLNPADIISRGMNAKDLSKSKLWFEGASFLTTPRNTWPTQRKVHLPVVPGMKAITLSSTKPASTILPEISSYTKLRRIMSLVFRFTNKLLNTKSVRLPRAEELVYGEIYIIRDIQRRRFNTEYKLLQSGKVIDRKSSISNLAPYFDNALRVIRVGGRLTNADLPEDCKHQYVLPADEYVVNLLVKYHHQSEEIHLPQLLTASSVRQRFWVLSHQRVVNTVIKNCVKCNKFNANTAEQFMGDLPKERVTPSSTFENTGVDFAGPIYILPRVKGKSPVKSYIALYVCFSTKAIHLELAEDMSSNSFLNTLKRFVSRRGLCRKIFSDNGTNFVGGNNKLKEIHDILESGPHIEWCNQKYIEWKFNTPKSPHQGGLWEAGVKSTKRLLEKVLGNTNLTFPELYTLLCQCEAILNSRPLTAMSSDANDLEPLTAGHFLIFRPLNAIPEVNILENKVLPRDRFEQIQQLFQHVWQRYVKEYLPELQRRNKWCSKTSNIQTGTLVLLKDINTPPLQWPLGHVIKAKRDSDNLIRRVTVKTKNGIYDRSLHYIVPLPDIEENNTENIEKAVLQPSEEKAIDEPALKIKRPARLVTDSAESFATAATQRKRTVPARIPTTRNWITMASIILLALPLIIFGQVTFTPISQQSGIFPETIGKVALSRSKWNIISYFNLTKYWVNFNIIKENTEAFQAMCKGELYSEECSNILKQLQNRIQHVEDNNKIIASLNGDRIHKRSAPLSIIGQLLHGIAGIMDEDSAREIQWQLDQISSQQNYVNDAMKNLTSYQDTSSNALITNNEVITAEFKTIKEHINTLNWESKNEQNLAIFNLASTNLVLRIVDFEKTQNIIIEVLTDVRHAAINSYLITPVQLQDLVSKIRNHLAVELTLPSIFSSELYKTMEIQARVTDVAVVFRISIPLIMTDVFNLIKIHPLPIFLDNKSFNIVPEHDLILINDSREKIYTISSVDILSCKHTSEKLICQQNHPIYNANQRDGCEINVIKRQPNLSRQCNVRVGSAQERLIQLHSPNNWLVAVPHPEHYHIKCSMKTLKMLISVPSILTMSEGCTLFAETATLTAYKDRTDEVEYLSTDLNLTKVMQKFVSTQNLSINTVLHDIPKRPTLTTYVPPSFDYHDISHYSMNGLSLIIGIGVIIAIVIMWKNKSQIVNSLSETPQRPSFPTILFRPQPPITNTRASTLIETTDDTDTPLQRTSKDVATYYSPQYSTVSDINHVSTNFQV